MKPLNTDVLTTGNQYQLEGNNDKLGNLHHLCEVHMNGKCTVLS